MTRAAALATDSLPGDDASPVTGGSAQPTATPATRHSMYLRMIGSCWKKNRQSALMGTLISSVSTLRLPADFGLNSEMKSNYTQESLRFRSFCSLINQIVIRRTQRYAHHGTTQRQSIRITESGSRIPLRTTVSSVVLGPVGNDRHWGRNRREQLSLQAVPACIGSSSSSPTSSGSSSGSVRG